MSDTIRIQMLGNFLIYIDEQRVENPVAKSRKGAALVACLVLNEGRSVTKQQLLRALWDDYKLNNPDNALKTLVSRMRTILNAMSPQLGGCIVSERGSYRWESAPGVKVDVLELAQLLAASKTERDKDVLRELYQKILKLYAGDLFQTGEIKDEAAYVQQFHAQYLEAVYSYIELLRQSEEFNEISAVCRTALEVDAFDDRLHIELMRAMVNLDRDSDALAQYKHATNLTYRYLGTEPSEEMKAFYRQMSLSRKTLKFNLDAIRNQLQDGGSERGAFLCEYTMFREIYNLERHNLERLGATMFLGIIMIGDNENADFDSIHQENVMNGLLDICRENLRRGDIITHFAPTIVALLLPTVNYETGTMVMERLRQLFYKRFPNSEIPFHYRLGILGAAIEEPDDLPEELDRLQ